LASQKTTRLTPLTTCTCFALQERSFTRKLAKLGPGAVVAGGEILNTGELWKTANEKNRYKWFVMKKLQN